MKLPEPAHTIASLIDQYHAGNSEKPRAHLGCSLLGHPCDRWLWLSFRWAVVEKFEGRILRLFRRGQMEETTIVSDLRAIGIDIRHAGDRNQKRVIFGSHVSGSLDGIIESGVPEAPKKRHVAEFKTHSKKSFDEVAKAGVETAKPMHYVQIQIYMLGAGIDRALYLAVCKDDDRIYTERVRYVKDVAEKAIARGQRIALADRMPEPVSADPTWYQCRFCAAHAFCHKAEPTKHANCRTCAHSTAMANDTWRCERHDADGIPTAFQHEGCDDHVLHPDMVPWPMTPSDDGLTVTWQIGDRAIVNGPGPGQYKSREIVANPAALDDPMILAAKAAFPDAEVIG